MNIYIRNGIPLLPASESEELIREKLFKDLQYNLDLLRYIKVFHRNKKVKFFHIEIDYEEFLRILPTQKRLLIQTELSHQYAEEIICACIEKLNDAHKLSIRKIDYMNNNSNINYEMIEMEDDASDECIELLLKLR